MWCLLISANGDGEHIEQTKIKCFKQTEQPVHVERSTY